LYNPFNEIKLKNVIAKITESYSRKNGKGYDLYILYRNPTAEKILNNDDNYTLEYKRPGYNIYKLVN
jgi:hypothetical protein